MEIFYAKANLAYFFVWSPKAEYHVEKILPIEDMFTNNIIPKRVDYFKNTIPQLLGRNCTNQVVVKKLLANIFCFLVFQLIVSL